MAKSLYRCGGNLLRVPNTAAWQTNDISRLADGLPAIAGKLWRGVEICCPTWAVSAAPWHYCFESDGAAGSVYTPNKFLVNNIAGITDCPGCDWNLSNCNGESISVWHQGTTDWWYGVLDLGVTAFKVHLHSLAGRLWNIRITTWGGTFSGFESYGFGMNHWQGVVGLTNQNIVSECCGASPRSGATVSAHSGSLDITPTA